MKFLPLDILHANHTPILPKPTEKSGHAATEGKHACFKGITWKHIFLKAKTAAHKGGVSSTIEKTNKLLIFCL